MAHFAKYKATACGNMIHHYERDREATLKRENVREWQTKNNYVLVPENRENHGFEVYKENLQRVERKIRENAVTMCDCVISKPQNVPACDSKAFFKSAYDFCEQKFGAENVIGGYVHMDETTAHMHFSFSPVTSDGRLCAKEILNREMFKNFHKELQAHVENDLGYKVEILKEDRTQAQETLARLDIKEYAKVQKEIEQAQERSECLRRSVEIKESFSQKSLAELAKIATKRGWEPVRRENIMGVRERISEIQEKTAANEQALEQRRAEAPERLRKLESTKRSLAGEQRSLKSRNQELQTELRSVAARFETLKQEFNRRKDVVLERVREPLQRFLGEHGIRGFERYLDREYEVERDFDRGPRIGF